MHRGRLPACGHGLQQFVQQGRDVEYIELLAGAGGAGRSDDQRAKGDESTGANRLS